MPAADGDEAVVLALETMPAAIVMDVSMPRMNGLEATSEIRHRFPGMAVVIVTAHEVPGLQQVCHENGARDFVKKSRLYQDLPDVLEKFLISRA